MLKGASAGITAICLLPILMPVKAAYLARSHRAKIEPINRDAPATQEASRNREDREMPFNKILIATDGSKLADKAIEKGLDLAARLSAAVVFVTVTVPWSSIVSGETAQAYSIEKYLEDAERQADQLLVPLAARAEKIGLACERVHIVERFASEGILEAAKANGCDLIVMASHGRRGLSRFFLGSQTDQVLVQTELSVLVVR